MTQLYEIYKPIHTEYLYQIFETTRKNKANDLTIGLAMFRAERPDAIVHEEDRAMRLFLGRYAEALGKVFPDRKAFARVVADGIAQDIARAEAEAAEQDTGAQSGK